MSSTTVGSPPYAAPSNTTTLSSPPSSLRLDDTGIITDLNDFEEIGLADDHERGRTVRGRRAPSLGGLSSLRDLTHSQIKRPPFPALQTSFSNGDHSHLTAPKKQSRSKNKSRSTSPAAPPLSAHANGVFIPPPLNGASNGHARASPQAPKRMSWQRKTSEQLEQEYDSDDDVPPDTIFYNVPLSPRSSKAYSQTPSPDRETKGSPPPSTNESGERANGSGGRTRSISTSRSKGWNDAMQDLGPEAKELSEKLDELAEAELNQAHKNQTPPARQSPPAKKDVMPIPVSTELPPLQISNGMIDPLPISKEKEAVLSRTRPSWLPPKSKEEEKRHLREYQKMMRRSQDAERKRIERERQEIEAKARRTLECHTVWEKQIIPNWRTASGTKETRELWWKGVPPRCRGTVWQLSFSNHLAVSAETFRLALKRGREIEIGVKKAPSMYSPSERELFEGIRRDVKKTFEELRIFQVGPDSEMQQDGAADCDDEKERGPLHENLVDVLMAYAMYRSDVGYVYGTHVIAALLLLNLSAENAFICLANILNRPLPLAFYTQDEGAMSRAYSLFLKAFQYKLPQLFSHIHENLRLSPVAYLEPMFLTLFAYHCPVDIASRIWDVYAFEGDSFLVRTAVAVMTVLESKLYGDRDEVLGILGWSAPVWDLGKEDDFMAIVRNAGREELDKPADRF